jgi:hypothetical protein
MSKDISTRQFAWLGFVGVMIVNICACVNGAFAQINGSHSTPAKAEESIPPIGVSTGKYMVHQTCRL